MSEVMEEKSRGLKFAEQQLLRHGWEHGKGLGRAENGISEAIKVKVKSDKGGVGHKEGEQFTFQWWDHVFNKASSSLQVESDQNGIKLKKIEEEEDDTGTISNKKPRKASLAKAKLYGCFVKSATLMSGQEQPEPKTSSLPDSSSSDEDDDQRLDLSSTTKLSDSDLMKACGGRTAHKGARHGLTMSAKLARLEQQEAEFMAKYGGRSRPAGGAPLEEGPPDQTTKKKKSASNESGEEPKKKKKKKKRAEEEERSDGGVISEENGEEEAKRKSKNEKIATEEEGADSLIVERESEDVKKTKRKKKKKSPSHGEAGEEEGSRDERVEEDRDSNLKQKRKKCKKEKVVMEDKTDEETRPPKRKKKKKSRE